ncbi:hypothetical protein Tco_0620711 [Tanacetum coccineum]
MVAFLSKPAECEGFEQIVDFLNAHPVSAMARGSSLLENILLEDLLTSDAGSPKEQLNGHWSLAVLWHMPLSA